MKPAKTDKALLDRLLSTEAKAELLMLFHKNPGVVDTVEGVARRIGRTGPEVESDIRDFIDLGILRSKKIGKIEAILMDRSRDREIQESLVDYFKALKGASP